MLIDSIDQSCSTIQENTPILQKVMLMTFNDVLKYILKIHNNFNVHACPVVQTKVTSKEILFSKGSCRNVYIYSDS